MTVKKQYIDTPNTVKHYMDMAKMIERIMKDPIVTYFYIKTDDDKPKLFFDYLYYDLNMCDCNEYGILHSKISDIMIYNCTATCKISYEDNIQKFSIYIDKAENKLNMDIIKSIIKRSMKHYLWIPYSEFINTRRMLKKCDKLRLYAYDLTNDNGDCVELVSDIPKLLDCPVIFYRFTESRSISIYIDTEDFRNDNHIKEQEFIKNYAMEVKQNG